MKNEKTFSIVSMKRNFASLAMMAAFLFLPIHVFASKERRMELIYQYVEEAAAKEYLDPALIKAVIRVESNFNHRAVSRAGARGLMQLMPPTAEQLGFRNALDHKNPRANILAGTRYLREMINQFRGDVRLAVAAYNAGPSAVQKYRGVPPFAETRDYVKKVLRELRASRK